MRNFHQWVSTAAMLLLAWVAVTGVVLAIDSLFPPAGLGGEGGGPGSAQGAGPSMSPGIGMDAAQSLNTSGAALSRADLERYVANTVHAAVANNPDDVSALQLQLNMRGDEAQGEVQLTGAGAENRTLNLVFNAATGEMRTANTVLVVKAAAKTPWYNDLQTRLRLHDLIQDLHRGNIIGISGQVMDILTGLSFIVLSVTGTLMYFQMRTRRKQMQRDGWFWK
ncbi:MAG: PepSY-associated TM helix domain-containing protein [Steroidobacteraceae bacterium]